MSICAARKTEAGIEMAWDSHTSYGNTKTHTYNNGNPPKGGRVNGMIIAGAGCLTDVQQMLRYAQTHRPIFPSLEAIADFLCDFNQWASGRIPNFTLETDFLIACDRRLFVTSSDFLVQEVGLGGFDAIGMGRLAALVAMDMGRSPAEAVNAAIQFSEYCSAPIHAHTIT